LFCRRSEFVSATVHKFLIHSAPLIIPRGPELKYIVVTGGVMSGLGKGITAASLGRIFSDHGYSVTAIKIDPYINIDAGTMNPLQHGEVFVLSDGGEVDLDLGNYERFLDVELTREHNITTGKVYKEIIHRERRGDFLGRTVQIIPHITDEIKARIRGVSERSGADICLLEVGGTVGDIESMPFLEAVRQMRAEEAKEDLALVHVTLVPIDTMQEQKTKPTQHSVRELRELGLQPDIIVGRCKIPLTEDTKRKIALFCDVPAEAVLSGHDAPDVYEVPLWLEEQGAFTFLSKKMKTPARAQNAVWREMVERMRAINRDVEVCIVGKYGIEDVYLSIKESLKHAGIQLGARVGIRWVDSERMENDAEYAGEMLSGARGIIVPGGFGGRGIEGKIEAIRRARTGGIPYMGLCLGFQLAVVEFARNVLGLEGANSTEFDPSTTEPVIDILPEQHRVADKGATMRLGNQPAWVKEGSLVHRLWGQTRIVERHRHRYEMSPDYIDRMEEAGLIFSAKNDEKMETLELPAHMFFLATQFHPEFTSRPTRPSPAFLGFVKAVIEKNKS